MLLRLIFVIPFLPNSASSSATNRLSWYASQAKSVEKHICLHIIDFIIIDTLEYKNDYSKGDIKIPKDLLKIDVVARSARNRMKFFQAVSESGRSDTKDGYEPLYIPPGHRFYPL